MLTSFFIPGGAAQAGWTSYSPLATAIPTDGQTFWLIGMVFLITSSLLGSVNIIATIIQLRAPGLTWMRLPFFVWAQFTASFLLLLAFPPLEAAGIMQLMDKVAGTSFFLPTGLAIGGQPGQCQRRRQPAAVAAPVLVPGAPGGLCVDPAGHGHHFRDHRQQHPQAALGLQVAGLFRPDDLGFISFLVWAHHMYLTGMGTRISTFFQTTTMIISIPSVIILTCLLISLWGGSIRFNTPMLFALAFLPMFGIGGLTGLPLGFSASDIHLHDTYYVIGHFHYVVAPGTIFALFAGIYFWFPKITGRRMSEYWGRVHFWGSLHVHERGVHADVRRRGWRACCGACRTAGPATPRSRSQGVTGALSPRIIGLNNFILWGAVGLALAQVPFIINFFYSIRNGETVESDNPWQATTLEWQTPTPPPHGNFLRPPRGLSRAV